MKEEEEEFIGLLKELENKNLEIFALKQDLEAISALKQEKKEDGEEVIRLMKELEDKKLEISTLKQELETTKKTYELQCSQWEEEAKNVKVEMRQKSQEYEHRLEELRNKVKELEVASDSKCQKWNIEKNRLRTAINFQFSSLQVHLLMCYCQCYNRGAKHYNFVLNLHTSRN